MRARIEEYGDYLARLYPELHIDTGYVTPLGIGPRTKTITFQVTDRCNLACSYCYQINKGTRRMPFETAKKLVDMLLTGDKGMDEYISPINSPGIILDFIGGEPSLEIELINEIDIIKKIEVCYGKSYFISQL